MELVVLAGGAGKRLGGVYKPLVRVCGKPLILMLLEEASKYFGEITIVTHNRQQASAISSILGTLGGSVKVVEDLLETPSPLTGLYTASRTVNSETFTVVPADAPFIRGGSLVKLRQYLTDDYDAVVPRWPNGYIEPLIATYRRGAVRDVLGGNDFQRARVAWLLERIRTRYVDVTEVSADPHYEFFNINTLEDLEKARELCNNKL
ncbi:molybdenum cofactor guanylyltransferase [Infirmifilum lucidum]|uniref:Molybdenum cofactor guanylyltransferase n=1 Tax=Infirmifilum lucidum TaxID=2776706 RepID=A0A7L9FFI4_9CREN|nr:molybdenum cofactor guanylyltransferase [Infirmifilum lucidum]QOJ78437.1 molybdenum cofactor guanylyltransferase [Infirmifilum lucidum]